MLCIDSERETRKNYSEELAVMVRNVKDPKKNYSTAQKFCGYRSALQKVSDTTPVFQKFA